MNDKLDPKSAEFAERTAGLLRDSVSSLSAAQQSRLTQARHRALDEHARRAERPWWQRLGFGSMAPLGGVAAACVLAIVLSTGPGSDPLAPMNNPALAAGGSALEDLDILADADALDLTADADPEFYEWAALQTEVGAQATLGT